MKKVWFFLILVLVYFWAAKPATAGTEFNLAFNSEYEVKDDGITIVKANIQLTNLATNIYAAAFVLEVPDDVYNLIAFDNQGQIEATLFKENGRTKVKLILNSKVLGVDQANQFVLRYETKQIAFKDQYGWKILIPRTAADGQLTAYNVSLHFPESWGEPVSINPQPNAKYQWNLDKAYSNIELLFSPEQNPVIKSPAPSPISQKKMTNREFLLGILVALFLLSGLIISVRQKLKN